MTKETKIVMNIPEGDYTFSKDVAIEIETVAAKTTLFIMTELNNIGLKDKQHIAAFRTVLVEMIRADEYAQNMTKDK